MALQTLTAPESESPAAPQSTEHRGSTAESSAADQAGARSGSEESPFSRGRIGLTIGLILTIVVVAFEALAVATVLPAVVAELGGLNLYGWAFSAFLLAQLVGIVVAGLLADVRGPALPFTLGIGFFATGLLIGGLAPAMPILIGGRALQGLGGGAISAIAYVAIARGYAKGSRPRMLALTSTAWVVPGLVGPGVAGIMAEGFGWRSVFLALAPLAVLAGSLALPSLRQMSAGTPSPDARIRTISAIVLAVGTGLFLTGIGMPNPPVALALSGAGLALAIPALRRLLPPGTLRARPGLPAAIAAMGLVNLAFFGVDAFVPLSLVEVRGTSVAFAGLTLTAATVMWTTGAWLQSRSAPVIPRRHMARLGLALIAAAFIITAAVLFPNMPLPLGVAGWAIAGLGMGLAYTTFSLTMLELAPPGQEGEASASLQLAGVLGFSLGAGVGGALIALMQAQGEPLTRPLLLQYGLMLLVVVLALVSTAGLPGRVHPDGE